jgi:manganese transport protein
VPLPPPSAGFWKHYRAFVGPAFLVSVGYMDPGNWATDLKAGAEHRYGLLWVVALASFMAIIMQILSARLGVVTGKDLAQACRDYYPRWTRWPNWLACELAIGACDLAEVLGSAIALNLLFGIPLFWAVIITAFDVLLLLALQGLGMRFIEALILVLVATIGGCYFWEIFILPQTQPSFREMGAALLSPSLAQKGMLTTAIGIIGATVMPNNLYLHSALVNSDNCGPMKCQSGGRFASMRWTRSWPFRWRSWSMRPSLCWRRSCFTGGLVWRLAASRWSSMRTRTGFSTRI